jgi:hypothetical protein
VGGGGILKLILEKQIMTVWTVFNWVWIGYKDRLLSFVKAGNFFTN